MFALPVDTEIDSHQHQKNSWHIWRHLRRDIVFSCNFRCLLICLHGRSRTHRAGPVCRISYNLYFDCKLERYVTCDLINEYTFEVVLCSQTEYQRRWEVVYYGPMRSDEPRQVQFAYNWRSGESKKISCRSIIKDDVTVSLRPEVRTLFFICKYIAISLLNSLFSWLVGIEFVNVK